MRPLLVSIALLLLALCRQSSAGPKISIESIKKESSTSSVSIISSPKAPNVEENIKKNTGGVMDPAALTKLLDAMPNFWIMALLGDEGKNLPEFFQKALGFGLLCEADDPSLKQTIVSVYPGGYTDDIHNKEKAAAKASNAAAFDCDNLSNPVRPEETCFCTDKSPLLFCVMIYLKSASNKHGATKPAVCRKAALDALKLTGSTELGKLYDADEVKDDSLTELFSDEAAGIEAITKADAKMTKIFCDAMDPNVENAVITLYNNDGLYWIAESLVYTILFGPSRHDLPTACKDSSFKDTKYGQCVCRAMEGKGTGFSFCIYKVLAVYFKEIGFLKCDGEKKFDAAKKPSALPSILPKAAGGSSSTDSSSTESSSTESGSSGSSSKASATTFSLLPPAAAAAVMLLLRQ